MNSTAIIARHNVGVAVQLRRGKADVQVLNIARAPVSVASAGEGAIEHTARRYATYARESSV